MASSWKENESLLRCQRYHNFNAMRVPLKCIFRDAVINTVILLVLVEFDIDRIQKKFHQADVAIVADHVVVDDLGHVTVAPVQEYTTINLIYIKI